jgi:hypothetical protein
MVGIGWAGQARCVADRLVLVRRGLVWQGRRGKVGRGCDRRGRHVGDWHGRVRLALDRQARSGTEWYGRAG